MARPTFVAALAVLDAAAMRRVKAFLFAAALYPLAATSTDRMARSLGGRRWQQLHHAVYLVAAAGLVHFWWLVKIDYTRPLIYSLMLAALPVARLMIRFRESHRR